MISDFIKDYGIAALLILAACLLGIFNIGILGYKFTAVTLFVFIAVVYLMFHVPTLWIIIKAFLANTLNPIWSFIQSIWKSKE